MGQPYYQLRELIGREAVAVFSANFALYGDMSRRVMSLLRKSVLAIEVYSIDEAFLDLTSVDESRLDELGHGLARTIRRHTGIPVSIGIAPTKTLAKIASKLCKQSAKLNGCCYMHRPEDIEKVLRRFPIDDVWGIGRRWAQLLEKNGVKTAWDFTQLPQAWVRQRMHVVGLRMWSELRGEPCIGFEEFPADKKQIATTRTSDRDVFLLTNRHKEYLPQHYENQLEKLSVPTDSTLELTSHAVRLLRRIFRPGFAYKRAGVILSDLRPKSGIQADLFDETDRTKHDRLMEAVDTLNDRFGRHRLVTAAEGFEPFKMNRSHLSQRYTTDWQQIIKVKI